MLDAINEDTRANTTAQISEEEARTADSFLNMSGDGGEEERSEEDDDFALPPALSSTFQYVSQLCMVT